MDPVIQMLTVSNRQHTQRDQKRKVEGETWGYIGKRNLGYYYIF